jgi:diadenosine tetraphosphatase ApaH/serine/threonine PP2A family protein phosphatase
MKYAILSDIHANLEALEAVLEDARPLVDGFVCLGDIVGYNTNPHECLETIKSICDPIVAGNHDQVAVGMRTDEGFNEYAKEAMDWTKAQLTPAEQVFLRNLPSTATFGGRWLAAHGSPIDTDEYLFHDLQFQQSFLYLQREHPEILCCFVGHTHLPMIWSQTPAGQVNPVHVRSLTATLEPQYRYIVNPGSVGQPRHGDPAASYVILDDEATTIQFRFVTYDLDMTQEKIYDAGLPTFLAERLALGR